MRKENKAPKEKKKTAIALSYDPNSDAAPQVVAAGSGLTAENICRIAQEHQVPVYKNEGLAQRLVRQELNTPIPPDLYAAVAEILAFVYRMDNDYDVQHNLPGMGGETGHGRKNA